MRKCLDCGVVLDYASGEPAVTACYANRGGEHQRTVELPRRMDGTIRSLWAIQSGDEWGECMGMWFAIAELLWALDEEIPAHWEFRASPMHERGRGADAVMADASWPETQLAEMYLEELFTADDLRHAGNVFTRYAQLLKLAGKDY
jgi:hypothetical protein